MIELTYTGISAEQATGYMTYATMDTVFSVEEYAEKYNLNHHDIDAASVHAVQDAIAQLNQGQFLHIDHENIN
jgi:hypothetical protein